MALDSRFRQEEHRMKEANQSKIRIIEEQETLSAKEHLSFQLNVLSDKLAEDIDRQNREHSQRLVRVHADFDKEMESIRQMLAVHLPPPL